MFGVDLIDGFHRKGWLAARFAIAPAGPASDCEIAARAKGHCSAPNWQHAGLSFCVLRFATTEVERIVA